MGLPLGKVNHPRGHYNALNLPLVAHLDSSSRVAESFIYGWIIKRNSIRSRCKQFVLLSADKISVEDDFCRNLASNIFFGFGFRVNIKHGIGIFAGKYKFSSRYSNQIMFSFSSFIVLIDLHLCQWRWAWGALDF